MGKIYLNKNVYESSLERLEYIFNEFDNVYFSFSGGKDSSCMLQLANDVAKKMNKKFDVLCIDLEGNYKSTRNHTVEISNLSQINEFYWVCLPLKLRNAVSQNQTHWVCWDEDYHKNGGKWIRIRPEKAITKTKIKKIGWDKWFREKMQFEDFIIEFAKWYSKEKGGKVACGVGIRSDESFNRFRTITNELKTPYKNKNWTTLVKQTNLEVYNFYPIYDYKTEDIWTCIFKNNYMFNEFYEAMYKTGASIHETRLCQPYGDDQRQGLNQFKFYEPETWGKVLMRVKGVNFGNIYAKTIAIGQNEIYKPEHLTWQEYSIFLLETIGSENIDLMYHYKNKINKFLNWWAKEGIINIPDEADQKLESKREVASWRRICKMLIKNDYYGKTLTFSQTKKDDEILDKLLKKWSELL